MNITQFSDFQKLDLRVGTIISVQEFKEAIKPAYKLEIDFGPLGILKSSAQITLRYQKDDLLNRQIIAVVNFPPKQIANFISECLVLGVYGDEHTDVILLQPEQATRNGSKIG